MCAVVEMVLCKCGLVSLQVRVGLSGRWFCLGWCFTGWARLVGGYDEVGGMWLLSSLSSEPWWRCFVAAVVVVAEVDPIPLRKPINNPPQMQSTRTAAPLNAVSFPPPPAAPAAAADR